MHRPVEHLDVIGALMGFATMAGKDYRKMKECEPLLERFMGAVEKLHLDFRDPVHIELLRVYCDAREAGFGRKDEG